MAVVQHYSEQLDYRRISQEIHLMCVIPISNSQHVQQNKYTHPITLLVFITTGRIDNKYFESLNYWVKAIRALSFT